MGFVMSFPVSPSARPGDASLKLQLPAAPAILRSGFHVSDWAARPLDI